MNSRNVESQLLPLLPSLPLLLLLLRVYFGEGLPLEGFLGGRTSWGGEEEGLQGGQVFGRDKLVLPFEEAEEVVAAGKAVLGAAVKEHRKPLEHFDDLGRSEQLALFESRVQVLAENGVDAAGERSARVGLGQQQVPNGGVLVSGH